MTERMAWRRAVERSRLPNGVKLTLLTHSERGPGHWHDDEANEHGAPRDRIADRLDVDTSTVRRHYSRAEADGFLVRHEAASRGRQTVFHYVTPSDPWPCASCGTGGRTGGSLGGNSSAGTGGSGYPRSAPRAAAPTSSSPAQPAPPSESYTAIVAAIHGADRRPDADGEQETSSPGSQHPTPPVVVPAARNAPAGAPPPPVTSSTTDRAREAADGFGFPRSWRVI